jgi:hypothetical protein
MRKLTLVLVKNVTFGYEDEEPTMKLVEDMHHATVFRDADSKKRNLKLLSMFSNENDYITNYRGEGDSIYQYIFKEMEIESFKRVEWLFNFEGGGWNSEYAVTKEEAYRLACERMPNLAKEILADSFRVSTHEDKEFLLRSFY